jgi:hypothetical protein
MPTKANKKNVCGIRQARPVMTTRRRSRGSCKRRRHSSRTLMHQEDGQDHFQPPGLQPEQDRVGHRGGARRTYHPAGRRGQQVPRRRYRHPARLNQAQRGDGQALLALWLDGKTANKPVPIPKFFVGGEPLTPGMTIPPIESVTTQEQGHDLAVQWQSWQSEQNLDLVELGEWQDFFEKVAEKFPGLKDEFKENAII